MRGQSDDAVSTLKLVYIQTTDPYGPLTKTLRSLLKAEKVAIAETAAVAPYTLEIKKGDTKLQSVGYGFSNQVSVNTVTYTMSYRLWGQGSKVLIPWRTVSTVRNFTINTNQALMGTEVPDYILEDMRRSVVRQLIDQLEQFTEGRR